MPAILASIVFLIPNVWTTYMYQNFIYPKWIIVDLMVSAAALFIAYRGEVRVPARALMLSIVGLAATRILATALNLNVVSVFSLTTAAGFSVLVCFFMNYGNWHGSWVDLRKIFWPFVIGGACIVMQAMLGQSPMGNQNVLSECLILLLPLGIYLFKTAQTGDKRGFVGVMMMFWLLLLIVSESRSAWLGLVLIAAYEFRHKLNRKIIVASLVAMTTFLLLHNEARKIGSTNERLDLYKNSVNMLLHHPLGVGGGGYEFNFLPNQMQMHEIPTDHEKFDTPHNEVLKWGIEQGWLFLLFNLSVWLWLGLYVWGTANGFLITSYLAIMPQVLFQFPFENPSSFAILAFLIGNMLRPATRSTYYLNKVMRGALVIFAILFLWKNASQTAARWIESQYHMDPEMAGIACKLDPTSWRICFFRSMITAISETPDEALPSIRDEFAARPFDYHNLRALGFYFLKTNRKKPACEVAKVYNMMFRDSIVFQPWAENNCKNVRSPIKFENPEQFRQDYLKWLGR